VTHTILLVPQYWARRASSFLVAAAACLPAPTFAADLAVPPPAFTWTGFYLGANAGGVLSPGNPAFQSQGFGSSAFDLPANGAGAKGSITAGFQAGYNYQAGPAVLGFETDFNYLDNCRSGTFAAPPAYTADGIGTLYGALEVKDCFLRLLLSCLVLDGGRQVGSIVIDPTL